MSDSYLPYQNPTTTDSKLDSESLTVGANTVERERVQLAGKNDVEVAEVLATTPTSGSYGIVVRNIPSGSQSIVGAIVISNVMDGTIGLVSKVTTGSIQLDPLSHVTVQNIKGGTITTVSTVSAITTGSIQLDPLSHVTVQNIKGGTVTTVSTVTSVTAVASVTTGSIQLDPLSHVTVTNVKGGTLTTVTSVTAGSIQLMASGASIGTVSVVPTLMSSITGATAGAGTTFIQAAVASKKIKVYAFDLSTTASAAYNEVKFVDGLAGGTTLYMFGLVNATGNCLCGISKQVTPPAYLFATTAGNTLTLMSSAAQPVNYNVSFWTSDAV